MTDINLMKMAKEMPNFAKENLDKGFSVSYYSDEYPDKLLKEYPNGKIESIDIDLITGEMKILEVLRIANKR